MGAEDEARVGGGLGFGDAFGDGSGRYSRNDSGGVSSDPSGNSSDHFSRINAGIARLGARRRERAGLRIGLPRSEGVREVVVTLLASIAFGLGWAAFEAGQANSALARDGIPAARPERAEAAPGVGTGYAPAAMERR